MKGERFKRYRLVLFTYQNKKCAYCSREMELPIPNNDEANIRKNNLATLDHIVPKSEGGRTVWKNLVLACAKCNNEIKNQNPEMKPLIQPLSHLTGRHDNSLDSLLEYLNE